MARLWISFCRPCLCGLLFCFLIYWSIYYYPPPPTILCLISLATPAGREHILRFAWNNLPLFLLLYGYLKYRPYVWMIQRKSKSDYARFPSFHVPVDCSVPLPASCLVFSAIRISPTCTYLFGLARWRPWGREFFRDYHPLNAILACYFWLWIFKEYLLVRTLSPRTCVISDGVRTHRVTPRSYCCAIRAWKLSYASQRGNQSKLMGLSKLF